MRLPLLIAFLSFSGVALAADIPNFPKPAATLPAGIPSACKEWTDSCRICALDQRGVPACSNIGIACLPQKWRCSRL